MEREAHPRLNFCKDSKCVQQTGPQSNRVPQTYRPTAELAEVHSKELKQAGRLQYYQQEWIRLIQDPWVLETISGYKIPFSSPPPSTEIPPFSFSKGEQEVISQEIHSLLDKGVIREAKPGLGFVNNIFLVPKSGQRWRLILNLKVLNSYTVSEYFKMEDISCVKDLLCKGDFMCKLDLKDTHLSIFPYIQVIRSTSASVGRATFTNTQLYHSG